MRNWNLFREMEQLNREFNHVLRSASVGSFPGYPGGPKLNTQNYPKINLREDQDNLYVEALLPGVDPKQVEINMLGNILTVSGDRLNAEGKDSPRGLVWHRRERETGKFVRTIKLPVEICVEKIKAEAKHGLLRVTLPKSSTAKPRKIEVTIK